MKKRKKKRKQKYLWLKVLLVMLLIILIIGLAVILMYSSGKRKLNDRMQASVPQIVVSESEKNSILNGLTSIAWQDGWVAYDGKVYEYNEDCINFLLIGIDRHGNLNQNTDLSDWNAGQADTIFVLSMNPDTKELSIIGIPRNSMVNLNVYNTEGEIERNFYNQICLQYGYAGGGELGLKEMARAVSELFHGLPISGVCALNFDSIGVVADMLGGIEITVIDDVTGYLPHYTIGSTQVVKGEEALLYLQYRQYSELGSPSDRLTRQKEFIKAAMAQSVEKIKKNPFIISDIYQAVMPYMNTDITVDEALYLGKEIVTYQLADQSFYQLTGTDSQVDYVDENGNKDFYDDYYLDENYLTEVMVKAFYKQVVLSQ